MKLPWLKSSLSVAIICLSSTYSHATQIENSSPSTSDPKSGCEVHIWQRGIYLSESPNSALTGIIGAIVVGGYNNTYPITSVEASMDKEFNIDALPTTLSSIKWENYTGTNNNELFFEKLTIENKDFNKIKASKSRNAKSQKDCYIEIYIDNNKFSGSGIKSWFINELYAKKFNKSNLYSKSSTEYAHISKVRFTDDQSREAAREIFRNALVVNMNKFLSKMAKQ